MGWKQDYERWRDMGHTWGPGIDDVIPYTEEELRDIQQREEAHQRKLEAYRVPPREKYLRAGQQLKSQLPDRKSRIHGTVGYDWRTQYNDQKLALCRDAALSLGYSFGLLSDIGKTEHGFTVTVDYYGWLPDRGGNIHRYAATGIYSLSDCLQLVSDFASSGAAVTTYYDKSFHYSCNDTGEVRIVLEHFADTQGITLPAQSREERKPSLTQQVLSASAVSDDLQRSSDQMPKPRLSDPEL